MGQRDGAALPRRFSLGEAAAGHPWWALVLLLIASEALFLVNLQHPLQMYFDETHYVPAARDLVQGIAYRNIEHPLVAKTLIGWSMLLFGDTPFGWRLMSTFFGCATIAALFLIAQSLFRDARVSLTAGILALLNQMLFVQARIAMLDIYMGAFLLLALWCLIDGYGRERGVRLRLIAWGALIGLAVGSKWLALPYAAAMGLAFLLLKIRGRGWPGVSAVEGALWLGGLGGAVYLASFAPAFFVEQNRLNLTALLPHQLTIYAEQTKPLDPHPYQSDWWQWAQIGRPIWYLYERVGGVLRGVLLIGNPAIMWGGLVAILACLVGGLRRRQPRLLLVAGLWIFSYSLWIVIPKKIGFYYYYYLPGLFLTLALAAAFHVYCREGRGRWLPRAFMAVSALLFAYFYPILSAAPLPGDNAFLAWTWFDSWR